MRRQEGSYLPTREVGRYLPKLVLSVALNAISILGNNTCSMQVPATNPSALASLVYLILDWKRRL